MQDFLKEWEKANEREGYYVDWGNDGDAELIMAQAEKKHELITKVVSRVYPYLQGVLGYRMRKDATIAESADQLTSATVPMRGQGLSYYTQEIKQCPYVEIFFRSVSDNAKTDCLKRILRKDYCLPISSNGEANIYIEMIELATLRECLLRVWLGRGAASRAVLNRLDYALMELLFSVGQRVPSVRRECITDIPGKVKKKKADELLPRIRAIAVYDAFASLKADTPGNYWDHYNESGVFDYTTKAAEKKIEWWEAQVKLQTGKKFRIGSPKVTAARTLLKPLFEADGAEFGSKVSKKCE